MQPRDVSPTMSDSYTQRENFTPQVPQASTSNIIHFSLIFSLVVTVIFVAAYFLFRSIQEFASFRKVLKWLSLVGVVVSLVLGVVAFMNRSSSKVKPVPAPKITEGKIKGVSMENINLAIEALSSDTGKMRELGINTLSFGPELIRSERGGVYESARSLEQTETAINMAHMAGFRVMLKLSPRTGGKFEITDDPQKFAREAKKIILKYAEVAEDFNVSYFVPLAQAERHLGSVEANTFLQDLMPDLKKRYSGKLVYMSDPTGEGYSKKINQDHQTYVRFKITGYHFAVDFRVSGEEKTAVSLHPDRMTVTKHDSGNTTQLYKEHFDIAKEVWHDLQIEQKGNRISIYLDGELKYAYQDEKTAHGSYILRSGGVVVDKFETTDLKGNSLIGTGYIGENFITEGDWETVDNQLVGGVAENPEKSAGSATLVEKTDLSGFDTLAVRFWKQGTRESPTEYREEVKHGISEFLQRAKGSGLDDVIIGELGGATEASDFVGDWGGRPMTGAELAQVVGVVLEEAEEKTNGYLYSGWNMRGQGINQVPEVEKVIKAWYTSH